MTIREPAPAKINLFLHVTGRRTDGYHTLDSLVVFAGIGDTVAAEPDAEIGLGIDGPFALALAEGDNLVLRAARALAAAYDVRAGARLTLTKRLPVASGIGGGSADAAAVLRVLARLWGLPADMARLRAIGRELGADVPMCVASSPARVGGIGDEIVPIDVPPTGIVLLNPGVPVSTAEVFAALDRHSGPAALAGPWADAAALAADLGASSADTWRPGCVSNDLEAPARALCPAIGAALAALAEVPGVLLARMSGSGATVFGLCRTEAEAKAAARHIGERTSWWCWGGGLFLPDREPGRMP